jgi:hypothetical protein
MSTAIAMKSPETVMLTYDKANAVAKKTLKFFLSLGVFQIQDSVRSQVEEGLEEYRQGRYVVVNRGKSRG